MLTEHAMKAAHPEEPLLATKDLSLTDPKDRSRNAARKGGRLHETVAQALLFTLRNEGPALRSPSSVTSLNDLGPAILLKSTARSGCATKSSLLFGAGGTEGKGTCQELTFVDVERFQHHLSFRYDVAFAERILGFGDITRSKIVGLTSFGNQMGGGGGA